MTVTRDQAIHAYRLILGREPENDAVIEHAMAAADVATLRRIFLDSPEFALSLKLPIGRFLGAAAADRNIECTPEQLQAIFDRIGKAWRSFGETEPHWSVVLNDNFRQANLPAHIEEFYKGGQRAFETSLNMLRRAGLPTSFRNALDFGCGVGRLSLALAPFAQEVIGVDISPPHLRLAGERASAIGASNVRFEAIGAVDDMDRYRGFDFAISLIVLQHNPPPVMAALYAKLLAALAPGGVAIVQMPTFIEGQSFSAAEYLASEQPQMEMNALAQPIIHRLTDDAGCRLIEVREDGAAGRMAALSHTFCVQRKS